MIASRMVRAPARRARCRPGQVAWTATRRCIGRPSGVGSWGPCDAGLVAGAEALIFGVLVFVLGTIIVLNAWVAIDARFATSAAAREAVRAAVEAAPGVDLDAAARQAGAVAFAGHGREPGELTVTWDGGPGGPVQARCAPVSYRASTTVAILALPRFGGRSSYQVASVSSELIDPFRDGLVESVCAS